MNLASLFGAAGAGFKGYDEDQQEAARLADIARQRNANDEDRVNRLKALGFETTLPANPALNAALPPPGGQAPQGGPSSPLDSALTAPPKASAPTATVTTAAGPQTMTLNYDNSPEGLKQRHDTAMALQAEARQKAVDAQKATEAAALKKQEADQKAAEVTAHAQADYNTLKALAPNHALVKSPFDPQNIANYSKAIDAVHQSNVLAAGQNKQHWTQAGEDKDPNSPTFGKPLILNTETGETKVGGGSKTAGAAGGQTRLPERTQQLGLALHNAVEALPFHDKAMDEGAPGVLSGFLAQHSQTGSLPARGALNTINPDYEKYIDAINGSLLAVAHSVGGARINKEQVNMFSGNMMVSPNDPPETVAQKTRAIIDFMNSARATLPPDAVAAQEGSLDPKALAYLRGKGYGAAPSNGGMALVSQIKQLGGEPAGATPNAPPDPAKQAQRAARWNALVTGGMDKASATAQVTREIP